MLDKQHQEHFEDLLLNMRAEVSGAIAEKANQSSTLGKPCQVRLWGVNGLEDKLSAIEMQRRQKRRLQAIERALNRLAKNDFGNCFQCNAEIGLASLQFDPTISCCIDCAD